MANLNQSAYRLTSTSKGGCPNTLESGSEKPFDFVMFYLPQKFIV
jgi:hypothetical protein